MTLEVPPRAQLEPPAPVSVQLAQSFPGGWTVGRLGPGLQLEQQWTDNLVRRGAIPVAVLMLGLFFFSIGRGGDWGKKLLVWSLAFILFAIAALGVLNFLRQLRRKRAGVRLTIDASTVTGYPEARSWLGDYFARIEQHPRAKVKGASLTVHRDPRRGGSRAKIHIELEGGGALVGPEASGEDLEWVAVRDALLPAAAAVAQALNVKLTLAYPWCEQRVEVSW